MGDTTINESGTSRRDLIKKAAAAGGALWAVPVVDSILSPAGAQTSPVDPPGLYRASFDGGSLCSDLGDAAFIPPSRINATNGQQCAPSAWNNLPEMPGTITSTYDSVNNLFIFTVLPSNCTFAEVTRGRCNQPTPCCQNGILDAPQKTATHDPCGCCDSTCQTANGGTNNCASGPDAGCGAGCSGEPFEIVNMVMACV